MKKVADKKYAIIGGYGSRIAVPISILEQVLDQCFFIDTSYNSKTNSEEITKLGPIKDFKVITGEEINMALATAKLQGDPF